MKSMVKILVVFLVSTTAVAQSKKEEPKHLTLARELVKAVKPEDNLYFAKPTSIVWPDEATAKKPASNASVCSSFCTALLRKSYRLSPRKLEGIFTEEWPEADEMFAGMSERREFEVIETIDDVKPGDFLVVDYLSEKAIPTGHVMLISGEPDKVKRHSKNRVPFTFASKAKTREFSASSVIEWKVMVIDSSKSPHGKEDTRYQSAENGEDDDGLGEGPIRLLTDSDGKILGYTWSMYSNSSLWLVEDRPIVVARWK